MGRAVSISPDGRRAVSGSKGSTVRVWDLETGECEQVLEGHADSIQAVSITPDGRRAVSGSFDKTIRVWDLETGECERVLEGHTSYVDAVSITPDGKWVVSGSEGDKIIRVWLLETGRLKRTTSLDVPLASLACSDAYLVAGATHGAVDFYESVNFFS